MAGKLKVTKAAISVIVVLVLGLILACVGLFLVPIVVLATIDYGLQDSLGYTDTAAILEEQAEYVTTEQLSKGKIRSDYAADLEQAGLLVGQVTASGEFVRTDVYIADLGSPQEIASLDPVIQRQENGQLAIMFDNKIITADNFVAALESNPIMYAAYSKALNISTRYYYSKEVGDVLRRYGLSRSSFSSWKETGSISDGNETFYDTIEKVLGSETSVYLNGLDLYYDDDDDDEDNDDYDYTYSLQVSGSNADALVGGVSSRTKSSSSATATEKAGALLNAAISSSEPYVAAKAFLLTEEAIQRARADGDGPVNTVMNALSKATEIEVYDVESGEKKTVKKSILGTGNFVAAFSDSSFSQEDALSYSRDRVINTIGGANSGIINGTSVAASGDKKFNLLTTITGRADADGNTLSKNKLSVENTFYSDSLETFESSIGANRIIEGGSFLSNLINLNVLGAMPSDAEQIAAYRQEVETVLARRAEADRATRSPFDISSANTLFGGLARKFAAAYAKNIDSSSFPALAAFGDVISSSLEMLTGTVRADSEEAYGSINGKCPTANSVGVEGDLYCNTHNTVNTSYMSYTLEDYKKSAIGGSLNADGSIKDDSALAQFVALGMGREVTVGVESSDTCERWKDFSGNQGIFGKISDALTNLFGLYQSCRGVDSNVATGANYTLSSSNANKENVKLYSSYIMYQMVSSLISDAENQVTAYKERYYAEHPFEYHSEDVSVKRV